jgi:hypothetical protein
VALLITLAGGAFNGRSDQWVLVSPRSAASAAMGSSSTKARRLAGAQTIDFPGFMRDTIIAAFHFQCPPFSKSVITDGNAEGIAITRRIRASARNNWAPRDLPDGEHSGQRIECRPLLQQRLP